MIYALIALIIAGGVIALLAIIVYIVIRRNSRLERERKLDVYAIESELAGKEALKAENGKLQAECKRLSDYSVELLNARVQFEHEALRLQQELHYAIKERNELEARNTALSRTLEAQPTMPAKRVRKNTAQTTGDAS